MCVISLILVKQKRFIQQEAFLSFFHSQPVLMDLTNKTEVDLPNESQSIYQQYLFTASGTNYCSLA